MPKAMPSAITALWTRTWHSPGYKENISQFGGDPQNVTLAGESSGGESVLTAMVNPHSAGKFQQVISMSGNTSTMTAAFTQNSIAEAEAKGIAFAEANGLKDATAEQLRSLSTETNSSHSDTVYVDDIYGWWGVHTRTFDGSI